MHPERDESNPRVIDQPDGDSNFASKCKKPVSAMKQSIYPTNGNSNDVDMNITSKRRRIKINDHVELYFYPGNKE